jgi:hypothetical protein
MPDGVPVDGAMTNVYNTEEKARDFGGFFEKTVLIYDTQTGRLSNADPLIEQTAMPSAAVAGDILYILGGEGGPRAWPPCTLQIGKIAEVIQ